MAIDPTNTLQEHANVPLSEVLAATAKTSVVLGGLDLIATNTDVVRYVHHGADATVDIIYTSIDLALTVGDATVTASIDGVAVTGGVVTITQAGSAPGDVDSATPTALNTITEGQTLELTAGDSNTAAAFADASVHLTYTPVAT